MYKELYTELQVAMTAPATTGKFAFQYPLNLGNQTDISFNRYDIYSTV